MREMAVAYKLFLRATTRPGCKTICWLAQPGPVIPDMLLSFISLAVSILSHPNIGRALVKYQIIHKQITRLKQI
jgi:hypothetical protein